MHKNAYILHMNALSLYVCSVLQYIVYNHPKTIENIQNLPKIADVIQKMMLYLQGIFINQAINFTVDVSNKWIHENEI